MGPEIRAAAQCQQLEYHAVARLRRGAGEGRLMIPELGHFALACAVALAFAQGVVGIFGPSLRDARALFAAPVLACSHFAAVGTAFLALVWAGIVSDFTVE